MATYYITTVPVSGEDGIPPRLVFDALSDFTPTFSQNLTSYAISDRSVISTHLSENNTTITASGWVTSTPTAEYENNIVGYDDIEARPLQAYDLLSQWYDQKTELTVASEYEIFSPVVITSYTPVNRGSDALNVDLSLEVARRVSYKRVRLIQNVTTQKELDGKNNTSGSTTKEEKEPEGSFTSQYLQKFQDQFSGIDPDIAAIFGG